MPILGFVNELKSTSMQRRVRKTPIVRKCVYILVRCRVASSKAASATIDNH